MRQYRESALTAWALVCVNGGNFDVVDAGTEELLLYGRSSLVDAVEVTSRLQMVVVLESVRCRIWKFEVWKLKVGG